MKKLIVTLLLLLFAGCELTSSDTSIKVKTNYAGNYVVIMDNYGDTLKTLISNTNGNREWGEDNLVAALGELGTLKVHAVKSLGDAYPDCGVLSASIWMGDDVLVSDEAGYGETEINLEYGF